MSRLAQLWREGLEYEFHGMHTVCRNPAEGCFSARIRGDDEITGIVIHHSATATAEQTIRAFQDPGRRQISTHFIISRTGTLVQMVPLNRAAFHAGEAHWHGQPVWVNGLSIGIELVNEGTGLMDFPPCQFSALVDLVVVLCKVYGIGVGDVLGHRDVAIPASRKIDPARNFPWSDFLAKVVLKRRGLDFFEARERSDALDLARQERLMKHSRTAEKELRKLNELLDAETLQIMQRTPDGHSLWRRFFNGSSEQRASEASSAHAAGEAGHKNAGNVAEPEGSSAT